MEVILINRKYILTDETKIVDGHVLHRIQAVKNFANITKGDLGGFVESDLNLSRKGNCWIYNDACVYAGGIIYNDAKVFDEAQVFGNAIINDNAKIRDNAEVYDYAKVYNKAQVCGNAKVYRCQIINYGTVMTDIIATKDWELALKCIDEKFEIKNNKCFFCVKVCKTKNKNIFLSNYNDKYAIFQKNKIINFIDVRLFFKNRTNDDLSFAKCEVDLNDIKLINYIDITCTKLKILNIVTGDR